MDAVFSYAGRTAQPVTQPLPTRVGGFGGVAGLVAYLKAEGISQVVDATHPFAAQMSCNAINACKLAGVPLLGLERAPWQAEPGDDWVHVPDISQAVEALPEAPARVFLAIGKQMIDAFTLKPQHHYLLRLVDPPGELALPDVTAVVARGPFDSKADLALLRDHRISQIVAKNAGGSGAKAKIMAARALGLRVIMIDRPQLPPRQVVALVPEVMAWLDHSAERGV